MHSGPPFANGKAHLGHFYNMVGKDAINRYKLMRGYKVHMMPGFDCYGAAIEDAALIHNDNLPTTLKQTADTDSNISKSDAKTLQKRATCREYVKESILAQMSDLSKWGILTDFRYSYFTMMPTYEANVVERFADLLDKKMVKVGDRPVFWSVQ